MSLNSSRSLAVQMHNESAGGRSETPARVSYFQVQMLEFPDIENEHLIFLRAQKCGKLSQCSYCLIDWQMC